MILDLETHFNMNITYSITIGFELFKLSLNFVECQNSHFECNAKYKINLTLNTITIAIKRIVKTFFNKGHSFSDILYGTPFCWLDLSRIYFLPNYGDYFIWGGLTPEYKVELCPEPQPYGPWTAMLLDPKQFGEQILKNIMDNINMNG